MKNLAWVVLVLAACGDDGGSAPIDAAGSGGSDAAAKKVTEVTCPATVAATVMTVNGTDAFMPMASTVSVGGVVKFVMSSHHDVAPNPIAPMSDPATVVGFGQTKCFRFDATGTYGIYCSAHSFAGTITVQ